jgi:drug/metabolite transporter (DMT)-like permease
VETIPPLLMAGLRFFVGGLLIFTWMAIRGANFPRPALLLPTAAIGIPLVSITYGLLNYAQQTVPSGMAALFLSMIPMWIVIFDWIRPLGIRPKWPVFFGIGLGVVGVGLLVNSGGFQGDGSVSIGGASMLIFSSISWSLGSIASRHVPQPDSKVQGASIMMISGGAILLIASQLAGEISNFDFRSITIKSWLALAYITFIGLIGHISYIWLLSVTSAARVATYAFVNPVVAIILGILLAHETLSLRTILCSTVIISSVMIIVLTKSTVSGRSGYSAGSSQFNINKRKKLHEPSR